MLSKKSALAFIILPIMLCALLSCNAGSKSIKNAKYFGSVNPVENPDAPHILIEFEEINSLFNQLKRSKKQPLQASFQYVTLQTGNEIDVTLQIIKDSEVMRVIKGNRTTDLWYAFEDKKSIEDWKRLLTRWQTELEVQQSSK